jgi:hypothetical protein
VRTLRARPGEAPRTEVVPLSWTGPDTLTAEIPLEGEETALSTVSVPGQKAQAMPPVCLPYSPEYAPGPVGAGDGDHGREALERLARATGGVERVELSGAWKDLPRRPRAFPLAAWLLTAAVVCLLLEVLERRTGLVSHAARLVREKARRAVRWRRVRRPTTAAIVAPTPAGPVVPTASLAATPAAPVAAEPTSTAARPTEGGGVLDAMRQARERTRERRDG